MCDENIKSPQPKRVPLGTAIKGKENKNYEYILYSNGFYEIGGVTPLLSEKMNTYGKKNALI
jgi:hypothetical protein